MRPSVIEIGRVYCQLMEEVKARTETVFEIATSLKNAQDEKTHRHNIFMFEGLYLHLRKICELLSISALLIHNCDDLESPIGKMDEYAADKLINMVEKINENGFPKPVAIGSIIEQTQTIYLSDAEYIFDGADLKSLYRTCGDIMHIGHLKDILRYKQRELNQDFVIQWCHKLIQGLKTHAIGFPDGERYLFVVMQTPDIPNVTCRLLTKQ